MPIASASKWYAAILIMCLVHEGKFSLNDKVNIILSIADHRGVSEGTNSVVQYHQPVGYRVSIEGKLHVGPEEIFSFGRI